LIEGTITDDGVPAIDVEVGGEHWRAIIDTGFNGELELPERRRPYVNSQFVGRVTSLLAANQRIEEDVYLVDFPFDGGIVRVQATFIDGGEILIGTQMQRDYRLRVDMQARPRETDHLSRIRNNLRRAPIVRDDRRTAK
jgi:predicted aspartyl protease